MKSDTNRAYMDPALPVEQRVADLLSAMTLDEKVRQVNMYPWFSAKWTPKNSVPVLSDEGRFSAKRLRELLGEAAPGLVRELEREPNSSKVGNQIQRYMVEETRLGIPVLFTGDALNGHRYDGATTFPQMIGMASAWNADLVREIGCVMAREARADGVTVLRTPVLDLARDARWGRCGETFGEDPWLAARLGAAIVKGMQGDLGDEAVVAEMKHFVHGTPEGGHNTNAVHMGERELLSVYLPPFQAAVEEAGALCVMSAYNEIDGAPCTANNRLLMKILRDEWGFRGFVQSDASAIPMLRGHGLASSPADAVRLAMEAGVDVQNYDFPCYDWERMLNELVVEERMPIAVLNRAVSSVLRVKFLLGLFENPYVPELPSTETQGCPEHRALNIRAARESIVLLKNEGGMLPLARTVRTIAVIGPNAATAREGTYCVPSPTAVSVLEGLRSACSPGTRILYAQGCGILGDGQVGPLQAVTQYADEVAQSVTMHAGEVTHGDATLQEAIAMARQAEVVILVLGEAPWVTTGEGIDRANIGLTGRQLELAQAIVATGTPVVAVLINDRPLAIEWLAAHVPAIVEAWFPGHEGGTAIAEVLFGDYNPAGRLPVTLPISSAALPVYCGRPNVSSHSYSDLPADTVFAFGHGLSYTTFTYSDLKITPDNIAPNGEVTVTVNVTNAGAHAGDEVVQLYLTDRVVSVSLPSMRLRGFTRIHLLPGETRCVTFRLGPKHLAIIDAQYQAVVEPGEFEVHVGGSMKTELSARFQVR